MKKNVSTMILLLSSFLSIGWSCNDNTSISYYLGSLSLFFKSDNAGFNNSTKTIIPDFDMTIDHYRLSLNGPNDETINVEADYTGTLTINNLAAGSWNITVTAVNPGSTNVGTGHGTADVLPNQTVNCEIVIIPYDGDGTINFTITWNTDSVTLPSLNGVIESGTGIIFEEFMLSGGENTYTSGPLPAGYYTVKITLFDGIVEYGGLSEVVRIISDTETEAILFITPSGTYPPAPSITDLSIDRIDENNLEVTAIVDPPTGITYSWSGTGDFYSVSGTANPLIIDGYTDAMTGTVSVEVTNSSGSDLMTKSITADEFPLPTENYIADYTKAKESVLRSIPTEYINLARQTLYVAYQHTSHGTHVSRGMFGLQDYKPGDDVLFGIKEARTSPGDGKLNFIDGKGDGTDSEMVIRRWPDYATDLSGNNEVPETAFVSTTRNFLDDPVNADINVVMWSWCSIKDKDVSVNYLPGMDTLISEYGPGGTKIGTGEGQREKSVTFIFMTGHADNEDNTCPTCPRDQADLILQYCRDNKQFCLDYYSIDTHDMNDNYWEDAGDNGNSDDYGGNFYLDWQNSHILGTDWFENKITPDGIADYGVHNTQHITANRKAYAMWWILARIAGWDGSE